MNESRDVPVSEFRRHMAEYLDEVRSGAELRIVRNGSRVAARLVPPDVEVRSRHVEEAGS